MKPFLVKRVVEGVGYVPMLLNLEYVIDVQPVIQNGKLDVSHCWVTTRANMDDALLVQASFATLFKLVTKSELPENYADLLTETEVVVE